MPRNFGKSTIFNRLARQRIAIVEDVAGVTRDRHYADATSLGRDYVLIDTGGFDQQDWLAFAYLVADSAQDHADDAAGGRLEPVLHLHRFQHGKFAA